MSRKTIPVNLSLVTGFKQLFESPLTLPGALNRYWSMLGRNEKRMLRSMGIKYKPTRPTAK